MSLPRRAIWILILAAAACRPEADPEPVQSADPITSIDPADVIRALENRLLDANVARLAFHVTAEGAFQADIRGELNIEPGGRVGLTGTGFFGPDSVDLFLLSERGKLEYGNGPDRTTIPTPSYLTESLLIGLSRMGILHNLARLTENAPPDHAGGGVLDWVVLDSFQADTAAIAETYPVIFAMTVAGEPSGTASLEIDRNGYPAVRRQTVQFPEGEMRVVERYENVLIEP